VSLAGYDRAMPSLLLGAVIVDDEDLARSYVRQLLVVHDDRAAKKGGHGAIVARQTHAPAGS